jgi:signal transduction histidine kinase
VTLGAERCPEGLALFVADDGAGIPEAWIARLGTPFVRPPDARNAEGHGLGLAIVKRIAVMLGGDMVVESRLGHGTRVSLRMPLA